MESRTTENKVQTAAKAKTTVELINALKPELMRVLPKHIPVERMIRISITAVRANPKLQQCTPVSFLAALMQAAQFGLEPNTPLGQAYLIPYGNEVQFQIGYRGMIELCRRTGLFTAIYAHEVRQNDAFEYEYGLYKKLNHKPARRNRGPVTEYYAVYHLKEGIPDFKVITREEVEEHRDKYSPSWNKQSKSPWATEFDAMAKKTILKQLLHTAPISIELIQNLEQDETIKSDIPDLNDDFIDISTGEVITNERT